MTNRNYLILFLTLLIFAPFPSKASTLDLNWISVQPSDTESLPLFRKQFKLQVIPDSAFLTATALGIYDIELNGLRVSDEELKPGWTDYRKEVCARRFDITPLLRRGKNEIRVQLSRGWWGGKISRGVYGKNPPLEFAATINFSDNNSSIAPIHTDSTWEYATDGPLLEGDIYTGESYDARRTPKQWKKAAQTGKKPLSISLFADLPVKDRGERLRQTPGSITIYSDTIATGTRFGKINPSARFSTFPFLLRKGEKGIVDLGQNMVGRINFTAKAKQGTTLTLRHGEMLNYNGDRDGRLDDGPGGSVWRYNLREAKAETNYTFRGSRKGENWYPRHTFMGFRYVEIEATDDVEILELHGDVLGSDIDEWGEFECSDSDVNRLFSNILWGQRGNFLSVPTDCPQRDERLGWTGDTQIFSRTALYNSDAAGFYRKWMRDLRNSQREDGAYPDIAPFPNFWGYGTAAWGDAGVIVPWNVYEFTGDKTILEENFDSMERWMDWIASQPECGAGTATGDWLAYAELDPRFVAVAYYAYTSRRMEQICRALNKESRAEHYKNLYDKIRTEFQLRYLSAAGTLDSKAQTAYLLALAFELLPEAAIEQAKKDLRKNIEENGYRLNSGFVGTALLCPVLSEQGMDDLAYSLLLQHQNPSWLYSVDQGATTVWERWDSYTIESGFHKHPWNMNSFNHYAYGVIAEWMYAYMGGIRPDSPGFETLLLAPHADRRPDSHPALTTQKRINHSRVKTHIPAGDVISEWRRRSDGTFLYRFTIPRGIKYRLDVAGISEKDTVEIEEM